MQEAIERRASGTSRIPLDALIELAHDDFEEVFEADGLNIGLGGLAMRASVLPEVGTRMSCRFRSPADGGAVRADAEVVWAQDSGPHFGEFGMRFTALDAMAATTVQRIVQTWERELSEETDSVDDAPVENASVESVPVESAPIGRSRSHIVPSDVARLQLESVASPLVAHVTHRASDLLVVEQDLPFLKLGSSVQVLEEETRQGRIAAVDLSLVDEVPRLTFVVTWEEPAVHPLAVATRAVVPIADATVPDGGREAPMVFALERGRESERARARERGRAAERGRAVGQEGAREDGWTREDEAKLARITSTFVAVWFAAVRGFFVKMWRALQVAGAEMRPWLSTAWEHVARFSKVAVQHAGPVVARVWGRTARVTQHFVSILHTRVATRLPWTTRGPRVRRTAAAPSTAYVPSKQRSRETQEAPQSSRLRVALVLVLAAVAIALFAYAFMPETTEDTVPVHRPIQAPAHVGLPQSAPATQAPSPAASLVPTTNAPELAPPPTYASAPPSVPSLENAPRPHAPATLPPTSPYAVDVREEAASTAASARVDPPRATPSSEGARTFGASSVQGRRFVLRMSRPVESLLGARETDGFTVTIPGSLALDPAGPIAAAHPSVRRAMILNEGDRAVLNIRFEDGKRPAYRVVARGSSIEITLGT